jgi:hypothetical protein
MTFMRRGAWGSRSVCCVSPTASADTTVVEFSLASVFVTASVDANGVAKAVISTYSLPNGVHELSAAGCNAEGCAPLGAEILDVVVGNPKLAWSRR